MIAETITIQSFGKITQVFTRTLTFLVDALIGKILRTKIEFDSAIIPEVSSIKSPKSNIKGNANVLIFPNFDAGNIAYKITQRLAGYIALGPLLQGLNKPIHDLSRGCSVEDVVNIAAITALQKENYANI